MKRVVFGFCVALATAGSAAPAALTLAGDWKVNVASDGLSAVVEVEGPRR